MVPMPEILSGFKLDIAPRALLSRLKSFFTQKGIRAFVVGGFPRDALLGRPAADIDLAVAADVLALGRDLAAALKARPVVLDETNSVLRLVLLEPEDAGWQVDLSILHGSLFEDLRRRDFTIDALAWELGSLDLEQGTDSFQAAAIDPLGGLGDIGKKLVRATGTEVFRQDGVRLLRAVRLAAELGFSIEAETEALVKRDRLLIQQEAGERLREELLRLLKLTGSDATLLYMQELGLLTAIIPELAPSIGLEQHDEHQWDVLEHSARSVAAGGNSVLPFQETT